MTALNPDGEVAMTQQTDSPSSQTPELADILRKYLPDYEKRYSLHPDHYKVVADIIHCRTAYLGGRVHTCGECGEEVIVYNSCRNRHCPKCQTMAKERWLSARQAELLPVPYFHTVFTLPHDINPVALCNKKMVYNMLFRAATQTLLVFGKNPENGLGGSLGIIAILHTWNQRLEDHIHLHGVVPGGVLSNDLKSFKTVHKDYLFPVKAMSRVFRGKFMELFEAAVNNRELVFPGKTKHLGTLKGFRKLKKSLWSKEWVVYAKRPFNGPTEVLDYIARYTHRVAISNHRILSCDKGYVTFSYRNRKENKTCKEILTAVEFIRRFLLHVVPPKFMRIRHFGLLANRNKKRNIPLCRKLLGVVGDLPVREKKSVQELMFKLTGKDIGLCPYCGKGHLTETGSVPRYSGLGFDDVMALHGGKDTS